MKQNQSITRKFFNGIKIEIRFERYAIQFDDDGWKSIVSIESLEGKIIPGTNKSFKEIITEAEKIDAFDSLAEFAFDYINTEKQAHIFAAQNLQNSNQTALY